MAELSKLTGITIVSFILGSGLIVFAANSLYSDYFKRPHVIINIQPGNSTAIVSFTNTGISTAHHFRVTMNSSFPIGDPIFRSLPDELINFTKHTEPDRLVATADRLTPGNRFSIETPVGLPDVNTTAFYDVDVTYDEGSNYGRAYIGKDAKGFLTPTIEYLEFNNIIWFVFFILLLVIFTFSLPLITRKIMGFMRSMWGTKYILDVEKEIKYIKRLLETDILFNKQLNHNIWTTTSYDSERKIRIFNNYNYYRIIENFFRTINSRDSHFRNNDADLETMKIYNEESLYFAKQALDSIDWKFYEVFYKKLKTRYLAISVIIVLVVCFTLIFLGSYLTGSKIL